MKQHKQRLLLCVTAPLKFIQVLRGMRAGQSQHQTAEWSSTNESEGYCGANIRFRGSEGRTKDSWSKTGLTG